MMETYYHWQELKWRLIYSLFSFLITFTLFYVKIDLILQLITQPILSHGLFLIYTDLTEAFFSYLKLSLFLAFLVTNPYYNYQIWAFLKSGLYKNESQKLKYIFLILNFLFIFLVYIYYFACFYILLPFFLSFQNENIEFLGKINELVDFINISLLSLLVLPLILFISFLYFCYNTENYPRKSIIIFSFILASIMTPPDVISQIIMALILIFLFEACLFLALVWKYYIISAPPLPIGRPGGRRILLWRHKTSVAQGLE